MTQKCFKDGGRPCDEACPAFKSEGINGTNCIELAMMHANVSNTGHMADGLRRLGDSVTGVSETIQTVLGLAMKMMPR